MTKQARFLKLSEQVEPEAFSRRVADKVSGLVADPEVQHGQVWAKVDPSRIVDVVRTLRTDPELDCTYLTFLAGVDWQDQGFEVVIMLYSISHRATVGLNVALPPDRPVMPTITGVFRSADWHEREANEMFGIEFEGHPNMRKLYLPEDFIGHPLRKDFQLASRVYKPWPGAKDPSEAAGGGRA